MKMVERVFIIDMNDNHNLLEIVGLAQRCENLNTARISVRQRTGQIYRRILLGTDFLPASAAVFDEGLKIAKDNHSELVIAHTNAVPNELAFMPPACYDEWVANSRLRADKQMNNWWTERGRREFPATP